MTFAAVGPLARSAPSFAAAKNYATGALPASIAVGDLNGDGKPDLATANPASDRSADTVSVLLNRGDGSLQARRNYRPGGCCAVAIGELTGDGKPELVTTNFAADTISVLVNRGDGTFQAGRNYRTGDAPRSFAIGDLDGDGKPDLATANHDAATVSVLVNRGDGTFETRRGYRTDVQPRAVAMGDLTGDGRLDLATVNHDPGTVSVLVNTGDGSFKTRRDYATAYGPFWIRIGDVNGDRKPDLVSASMTIARADALTVSVFLNGGGGSFRARRDYPGGVYPNSSSYDTNSLAMGDLNGDGKPELAITCCDKASVSVLTNKGDGSFQPRLKYRSGRPARISPDYLEDVGDRASAVSIGDLNGDRRLDLAVANDLSSTASLLINAPGLCTVQDARGMTLSAAKRLIGRAGCQVEKVSRAYSKTTPSGRVISQKPKPGTVLRRGGKVNLVVSRGRKL